MPLIPNVPFTSGAVFTPDAANAIANPVFDDQITYLGHLAKIRDTDLSDDTNAIKARVGKLDTNLVVTAGSGLNALYSAGKAIYGQQIFDITSGSLTLIASTANYVYVGIDGVVRATTSAPPIVRALLAIVNTNTSGVISISDQRDGYRLATVKPLYTSVASFGGKGGQGAKVCTNGENFASGEYYYTDFTLPNGVSIVCDKLVFIYCSGNVNIAGTINVTPASKGGSATSVNVSSGALCPGQGLGGATSERFSNFAYSFKASPVGSGGSSGAISGKPLGAEAYFALTNNGGNGGGGLIIECAQNITVSGTGSITANGTDGEVWYNYVQGGANPVGGGTAGTVKAKVGGGGGGSGGHVQLKCLGSLVVSGAISCNGGRGGNGSTTPDNGNDVRAEAGAGGGGGWIVLYSPNINTTGANLQVNGGAIAAIPGSISAVAYLAYGGTGGSYAGAGGNGDVGDGTAGQNGQVKLLQYIPY